MTEDKGGDAYDTSYLKLPKVPCEEITLLWHEGYYDGMLSGMCMYKNTMHYFDCVDMGKLVWDHEKDIRDKEKSDPWYRRFSLVKLEGTEEEEVRARHALFQKHVGTHCDYDLPDKQRQIGATKPQEEWEKFYGPAKEWLELGYTKRPPIAWFEE